MINSTVLDQLLRANGFVNEIMGMSINTSNRSLAYQIKREKDRSIIEIGLPGVPREHIDVETKNGLITITVLNNNQEKTRSQRFDLPAGTDPSQVRASYENGLLQVSVYKKEAPLATKIAIE